MEKPGLRRESWLGQQYFLGEAQNMKLSGSFSRLSIETARTRGTRGEARVGGPDEGVAEMRMRVVLLVAALLGTAAGAWATDNVGLRPEWSVGQELLTPARLGVTPPAPAPASLTLQQAVDLALARNTGFRWTISNLLSARGALWVARQQWAFTLTGSGTQNQDSQVATDFGSNLTYSAFSGATFSVQTEWDRLGCEETADTVAVTLSQPLLAGAGKASPAYEAVRAARNAYRSALLSYFSDRQNLIMGVVNSYFSLVEQHESLTRSTKPCSGPSRLPRTWECGSRRASVSRPSSFFRSKRSPTIRPRKYSLSSTTSRPWTSSCSN